MRQAETLKKIRIEMGYTQTELASTLKISRSLLAMAESGRRLLPGPTMNRATALRLHFYPSRPFDQYVSNETAYFQNHAGSRCHEIKQLLPRKQQRLMYMQQQYQKSLAMFSYLLSWQENLPKGEKMDTKRLAHKKRLEKQLFRCRTAMQIRLTVEIKQLEAELDWLEGQLVK